MRPAARLKGKKKKDDVILDHQALNQMKKKEEELTTIFLNSLSRVCLNVDLHLARYGQSSMYVQVGSGPTFTSCARRQCFFKVTFPLSTGPKTSRWDLSVT